MKTITVKSLNIENPKAADVIRIMDQNHIEWNEIDCVNWMEFPYQPIVRFRIAHTAHTLLIHYRVKEATVRAVESRDNGRIWEDSCCEFFSMPANDGIYYNMECNCTGKLLIETGPDLQHREHAPLTIVDNVDRWASLGLAPFEEHNMEGEWDLALVIPDSTYFKHHIDFTELKSLRANFYKCGDKQQTPHYLSWSPIHSAVPNFHLPEYFATLVFE